MFLLFPGFRSGLEAGTTPQTIALLRHAFLKTCASCDDAVGCPHRHCGSALPESPKEAAKERGKDYVFLGWSPGGAAVIINMGQDLYHTFPSDYGGKATKDLPVLEGVRSLKDVNYAVSLGAGNPGVEAWYVYGKDKYRFELGGGCTGVMAPGLYPLLRSGQINGMIGGLRGAASMKV